MNNNVALPFLGFSKTFLLFFILSKFFRFYHRFSLSILYKAFVSASKTFSGLCSSIGFQHFSVSLPDFGLENVTSEKTRRNSSYAELGSFISFRNSLFTKDSFVLKYSVLLLLYFAFEVLRCYSVFSCLRFLWMNYTGKLMISLIKVVSKNLKNRFVKILSIIVAVFVVILEGLFITGMSPRSKMLL